MVSRFSEVTLIRNDGDAVRAAMSLAIDEWGAFSRIAVGKLGFWRWSAWRKRVKDILTAGKESDEVEGGGQK
jgi:hypothetical protein